MKYINHAVGYSTIELSLGEQGSIMTSRNVIWNNVKNQFKETISTCVDAFVVALKGSFVFISFSTPIILMCLLVALVYKWMRRIFPPKKIKSCRSGL